MTLRARLRRSRFGRSRLGALALAAVGLSACAGNGVQTPGDLVGQPLAGAVERYGPPGADTVLTVRRGDRLPEFQSGLYPAVIDTLADGATARVRQVTWAGDPRRAVWAVERGGAWVVVDALEWGADVQF